ncbi:MAG: YihA family ribosome biogenesis GTP-binding protein [Deltaproteobacteria bacterium]|nr:YihA family ribosome biogenesis GTP-binding protein [Deltaproteobacteria bacterium]
MNIHSATFVGSAVRPEQYPPADLPEVAFVGRSNVGKSSLINRLVNRKKLVRTSKTPGCTQLINFFEINKRYRFVDLPGYGYAKVPKTVRRRWRPMVETYLAGRKNLRGIVLLLDARRVPTADDQQLGGWLQEKGLPLIAVMTKIDKLGRNQRQKQLEIIARTLRLARQTIVQFSAVSGEGRDVLWQRLQAMMEG